MINKLLFLIFTFGITFPNFSNGLNFLIGEEKGIELNNNFILAAQDNFSNQDWSKYFDTKVLKNPNSRKKLLDDENPKKVEFSTADNIKINGYFIDRGANKAILIGQGFLASCEKLIPFFKIFPEYDLLIIDYRWYKSFKFPNYITADPLDKYIYQAKEDVIAAVKFLRNNKQYETITGIGICYSGLIYAIAQAEVFCQGNKSLLFDKLIIDSGYYSTAEIAYATIKDPKLCCDNKHGGCPPLIKSILSNELISRALKYLGNFCLGKKFERLSMEKYLPMIEKTPIMFIHGKKDLLIPYRQFEKMYNSAFNTSRCALITENEHTINHIKSKEAYSYLGKMFIEASSIQDFSKFIMKNFGDSNRTNS